MFGRKNANILVVKTDSLAAFVDAEPAFDAIRRAHPDAKISLLTVPALQRIARASPYFDQVAAAPDFADGEARKEFIKQLKSARFERVYDLAADDASKRLSSALGPFKPKWLSAAPARPVRKKGQPRIALPDLEPALQDVGFEAAQRLPDFRWALEARKDSANMRPSWYGITGPFGLLMPGMDAARRWTARGYAEAAKTMAQSGFTAVMVGPKELHDFGDEVSEEAPQLVDLTGKTDHLQLAALAQEAGFFISDDAEEVHLALSVGCEGVLVVNAKAPPSPFEGRHVVTLTSETGLGAVDAAFVWRTLINMGLPAQDARRAAAAATPVDP